MNELRLALRGLLSRRGPGIMAIVALALALGGCVTVWSIMHDIFLKPLPYAQPQELMRVRERNDARNWQAVDAAPANFMDWRSRSESFVDMAAFSPRISSRILTTAGQPRLVDAGSVTGNVFDVLGVRAAQGRVMTWEETWAESAPVVVLSDALWRSAFGAAPDIVGRSILLDGEAFEVIGVMPPSFFVGPRQNELWVPYRWSSDAVQAAWFRRAHYVDVIGRLHADASATLAAAELRHIAARLQEEHPQLNEGMENSVTPLHESLTGDLKANMNLLLVAVLLVLSIACLNVSGLLLARGIGRRHLYAVQAALGATRARLLRGPLSEALLTSLSAGLIGAGLAAVALHAVARLWPEAARYGVDGVVGMPALLVALLLVVGCTLLTGLLPAFVVARRARPADALIQGGRGTLGTRGAGDPRRWVLGLQLAGTMVLLAVAITSFSGFHRLANRDPGFAVGQRSTFRLVLPDASYASPESIVRAQRELVELLQAQPGIGQVGMISDLPFTNAAWTSDVAVQGRGREDYGLGLAHREVTPGFFRTLGVPLLTGDGFDTSPPDGGPPQVIVNRAFVDRYFPGRDPVGARIAFDRYPDEDSRWLTIVGVAADFRQDNLYEDARPEAYESLWQAADGNPYVVVQSGLPRQELRERVRAALHALDAGLPLQDLQPLSDLVEASVAQPRLVASVLAAFGLVAALLAAVGMYAALMFEINGRRREIGLRQALGADRRRLFGWLAREWRMLLFLSTIAGVLPGMIAAPHIDAWLEEIGGHFLAALMLSAGLVSVLGLLTGWLGGTRAAAVAPVEALREE